jgi:drug/metabolite transporter (DMT)-like permease
MIGGAPRGTIACTVAALVCFAANSILTRLALGAGEIDAASFTAVRLATGAVMLVLLVAARRNNSGMPRTPTLRNFAGAAALFAYAAPFSYAYLRIGAAVGALVLFGVVQMTMIGAGVARGERPTLRAWAGIALACAGLAALTLRGAESPDLLGVAWMAVAGVGWGAYSLLGRGAANPLASNAASFVLSAAVAGALCSGIYLWHDAPAAASPLFVASAPARSNDLHATALGAGLAAISGSVTSGLGYAIWYRALRGLTSVQAAVVQLAVPVLAAVAAVAFLGEPLTARVALAGAAILAGIALTVAARQQGK